MSVILCPNNHYYDNEKFPDGCPHCKAGTPVMPVKTTSMPEAPAFERVNHTVRKGASDKPIEDSGKTISIHNLKDSNPISGWLVCIEGENKGRSFEVHIGKNFVGRSMSSDVIINDMSISRNNHFSVIYEPKSRKFYISTGASIVHLNSTVLEKATELKENDVVEAGKSKFIFIPFCKEGRDWND